MAVLHVTTLKEGTPQVIVPGVADTYELIRDTLVTGDFNVKFDAVDGKVTFKSQADVSLFELSDTGYIRGALINVDEYGIVMGEGTNWDGTGGGNVILGTDAASIGSGQGTVIIGVDAAPDSGAYSVAVGEATLGGWGNGYTNGSENTAVGPWAGSSVESTSGLTAIGAYAGGEDIGSADSTYVGYFTGGGATGDRNTAIGSYSLYNSDGDHNVAVGRRAGYALVSGSRNIVIGGGEGASTVNLPSNTDDHQLVIGTAISGHMTAITDVDISAKPLTLIGPSALATAVTNLDAGDLVLAGGNAATTGIGVGGDVVIKGGVKGSTGAEGRVIIQTQAGVRLFEIQEKTTSNAYIGRDTGSSTGGYNVFMGNAAGKGFVDGDHNVMIGRDAGLNSNPVNSIGIGAGALEIADTSSYDNIFIGNAAGSGGLTQNANVGIGNNVMESRAGGQYNISVGGDSGGNGQAASGDSNCSMGDYALNSLTSGDENVAIGDSAGAGISTGSSNTIVGGFSGQGITGTDNVVIGANSHALNTTGGNNITIGANVEPTAFGSGLWPDSSGYLAIGAQHAGTSIYTIQGLMQAGSDSDVSTGVLTITGTSAYRTATTNLNAGDLVLQGGQAATTGIGVGGDVVLKGGVKGTTGTEGKVSIKSQADAVLFEVNTDGTLNGPTIYTDNLKVSLGAETGGAANSGRSVAIGYRAASKGANSDDIALGAETLGHYGAGYTGFGNLGIGTLAGSELASGSENTIVGVYAGLAMTDGDGVVLIGANAGTNGLIGDYNTGIGYNALSWATGDNNIGIGLNAGSGILTGTNNIVLGEDAAKNDITGNNNIGIGFEALGSYSVDLSGTHNICLGKWSGASLEAGYNNVCVGAQAGEYLSSGADNTLFGNFAGNRIAGASHNTAVGVNALTAVNSGDSNIGIGKDAGSDITSGADNIVIGNGDHSAVTSITGVHQLVIGTAITGYMSALTDVDYSANALTLAGPSALAAAVTNLNAGDLVLTGGNAATTGTGIGGDVVIKGGAKGSTGTEGKVSIKSQADAVLFEVDVDGNIDGAYIHADYNTYLTKLGAGANPDNIGTENVLIGADAGNLATTTFNYSAGVGAGCLGGWGSGPTTGTGNSAFGSGALYSLESGGNNTALGGYAGGDITTGSHNTLLGSEVGNTGVSLITGSYNTLIGDSTRTPASDTNYYLSIGYANYSVIEGYMRPLTDIDVSGQNVTILGTSAFLNASTNLDAGDLVLQGGRAATTGAGIGGDVIIKGGAKGSTGTEGDVNIGTAATSKIGFYGATPVDQAADTTAALTDITHTAPGTPDYAMQDMTNTTPYGFVTQDEANTLLSVVANLQARLAEVETVLADLGLTA